MSSSSMPPSSSPPRRASSSAAGHPSSPTIDFSNPEETAATVAAYKQRCASLSQRLEIAEGSHPPPKRPITTKTLGRGLRKLVSLYDPISSILDEANRVRTGAPYPDGTDDEQKRALARMYRGYPYFQLLVPQMRQVVLEKSQDDMNNFILALQEGANNARSDDVKRIKEEVYDRVNKDYKPNVLLDRADRDNRGLQHDVCGELLTPIMYDWKDPEVRAKIRAGTEQGYIISSNYYLRCLYPTDIIFDKKRIEIGFLRSKLLGQVYCSIFTSPSSAEGFEGLEDQEDGPPRKKQKSAKATKSNVSSLLNMDGKVTGRSIAYAAVLLVFNLTEAKQWTDVHNNFSFVGFYNFIVDYFEEAHERSENAQRRVTELLKWWNRQVFKNHVSVVENANESRDMLRDQDDDY